MSSSPYTKETKFAVLTGILALGIFAAVYSSTQMLNAVAQTTSEPPQSNASGTTAAGVNAEDGAAVPITAPYYYPNHAGTTSTVSTSGSATTKVQPDKFSVTVGVETNGTTAEEAADKNSDLMDRVIAALKELGISDDQISTSNYSVYPVYSTVIKDVNACRVMEGYPIPPECYSDQTIVAYKAVNSVTVTLDTDNGDVDAGEVIDTAIEAGANNVNGVYFFISQERQNEVRDSLITDAIDSARHRADIAADAVGMEVTGVQSINLNDIYFPIFSRGLAEPAVSDSISARPTPIMPGEQEITNTVNVVFRIGNGNIDETSSGNSSSSGFGQREAAMTFLLEKLPELGIQINDEMDIVMDMITHISETEYHADFSVVDTSQQVHDGHIEVVNGEVTVAELDGESIL
ncbi:MAG TPA: SIMPL domain-containing protein [Nitrososphaera sp.]|nr:SIMPL domain-containing protein [Nitrososphaera sp.]